MNIDKVVEAYGLAEPATVELMSNHTALTVRETAFSIIQIMTGKTRLEIMGAIDKMKKEQEEVLNVK